MEQRHPEPANKERVRMPHLRFGIPALSFIMAAFSFCASAQDLAWKQLPPIPDTLGVAGAFAGTSGGALLVMGGANFPDRMPWEGGTKLWYDTLFALDTKPI